MGSYHGEPNHAVLGHQTHDQRAVDLAHVLVIFLLAQLGLAVCGDSPA